MTSGALWVDEELDLRRLVTRAAEIEVEDKRYRRLKQASSAQYRGRWGAHHVEERLYRLEGVHNGPTIKPVEPTAPQRGPSEKVSAMYEFA